MVPHRPPAVYTSRRTFPRPLNHFIHLLLKRGQHLRAILLLNLQFKLKKLRYIGQGWSLWLRRCYVLRCRPRLSLFGQRRYLLLSFILAWGSIDRKGLYEVTRRRDYISTHSQTNYHSAPPHHRTNSDHPFLVSCLGCSPITDKHPRRSILLTDGTADERIRSCDASPCAVQLIQPYDREGFPDSVST